MNMCKNYIRNASLLTQHIIPVYQSYLVVVWSVYVEGSCEYGFQGSVQLESYLFVLV